MWSTDLSVDNYDVTKKKVATLESLYVSSFFCFFLFVFYVHFFMSCVISSILLIFFVMFFEGGGGEGRPCHFFCSFNLFVRHVFGRRWRRSSVSWRVVILGVGHWTPKIMLPLKIIVNMSLVGRRASLFLSLSISLISLSRVINFDLTMMYASYTLHAHWSKRACVL